jgi:hypothetical protein
MTTWEYLILELPSFPASQLEAPTQAPGSSAAVHALNQEGERGWEAVGLIPLADGRTAVLLKRPRG